MTRGLGETSIANLSHDSASTSTMASYTDATVEPDTLYTYRYSGRLRRRRHNLSSASTIF